MKRGALYTHCYSVLYFCWEKQWAKCYVWRWVE